jgi:RNA polymerase sigma-70 factor (ECF subfamily)
MSSVSLPRLVPAPVSLTIEELYRAHAADVLRWARRLGGGRLDADDVVQEVFLVAARRLPLFRGEGRPSTWLFRITARVAANHRRRSWLRRFWGTLTASVPERPVPAEAWPNAPGEARERVGQLYALLDRLPARQREAIVLFELEGMESEAIATLMGAPHATVRVWLHRARAHLARGAAAIVAGEDS